MKRFTSVVAALSVATALSLAATAGAAPALPTLNVSLSGASGVAVSGSTVSGAVSIVSTFTGKVPQGGQPDFGIVRLNPGASVQQAAMAVQNHGGDLNALTAYGTLLVDAGAPGTVQTVLTPGDYVALNMTGQGQPGVTTFTVTASASPAALPSAAATETAIDFGFEGPKVLHKGTIVRAQNHGWLVHMISLIGVRNAASGRRVMALLKAGKDRQAQKLATSFINLLGPGSPGALQQQVLNAAPGYYVEACFMDTEDGREHVQIGMERLVRVVK